MARERSKGRLVARAILVTQAVTLCANCSSGDKPPQPPPATASSNSGTALVPLPKCPGTGHWEACTVFDRIERAGLAPLRGDSVRFPFLRAPGQTWRIGAATLHVFRYRDSVSRHTDFAALDSAHARPRGDTTTTWPGTPTLLVNDNLLAILLSDNAQQVERVTLALTAGPPPKASPAAPQ